MPIYQTAHYQIEPSAVGAAAHEAHGQSAAVRQFEAVYTPHLVGGPVVFTNYLEIATNGAT